MPQPSRFGPYEVVAHVDTGGQAEVYRARDVRLNRDVAIKVLPHLASDPLREQRLIDEAQAASALNHPNIVTVYDVGTADGRSYVVSELIPGASLRTILARAPLPTRELLDLAVQMADGLAAAHREGIVHCDFKPGNVMVTPDGHVKILDFGLARMANQDPGRPDDNTASLTNTIQGTPLYMSPEQARGAPLDFRSDQFSFGLTLYEMATGKRAFVRETYAQVLAAIIEDEPRAIATVNARVPAPLRWVIERCLAKDKRQRYEATSDLARDLRTLRDRLPEFAPPEIARARPVSRWRRGASYAPLAALLLATSVAVWAAATPMAPNLGRFKLTPIAVDSGYQDSPAWSPDAKTLAYVAEKDGVLQIFAKTVGAPTGQQVTTRNWDCRDPFWSHDNKRIYYISQARMLPALWSISSIGGEPKLELENVATAALSPDGKVLATFRWKDPAGGTASLWFSSPDGSDLKEYVSPPFNDNVYNTAVLSFSTDSTTLGLWVDHWTARNKTEFWTIPLDGRPPHSEDKVPYQPVGNTHFSSLNDGRVVEALRDEGQLSPHLWIGKTSGEGLRKVTSTADSEDSPAVSPDGRKIAFAMQQANYDIVSLPLVEHGSSFVPKPEIATTRSEIGPTYSPAGHRLAYVTDRSGRQEIWMRVGLDGADQVLVDRDDLPGPTWMLDVPQFSHNGLFLAFYGMNTALKGQNNIWIKPVASGRAQLLDDTMVHAQNNPTWSPKDEEIAYEAANKFSHVLMRKRVGTRIPPEPVTSDVQPNSIVRWSPDGKWIAYNSTNGLAIISPDGKPKHSLQQAGDDREWLEFTWDNNQPTRLVGVRLSDDLKHLTFSSIDVDTKKEHVIADNFMRRPVSPRPVVGLTIIDNLVVMSIPQVQSGIWMLEGFDETPSLWERLTSWFR